MWATHVAIRELCIITYAVMNDNVKTLTVTAVHGRRWEHVHDANDAVTKACWALSRSQICRNKS